MLNLDYLPVTNDNVNLLKEEKKFMRAVFAKTLQIDRGKKYVREYEGDCNAQSACQQIN